MMSAQIRVLFVCLGNICRSPLAEAVFRHLVENRRDDARFVVDSAGTSNYHEGDAPDPRAAEVARRRGITLGGHARQLEREDLERFDYVVAMDATNLADVQQLARGVKPGAEVCLLREFDPDAGGDLDVPDPYFGGPQGFERVQDIIERSCLGLLEHIQRQRAR